MSEASTTLVLKGEAQIETLKPKTTIKLSNKTRKSKEGNNGCEIDGLTKTEQLLLEDNAVNTTYPNMSKKNEHVQPDGKARTCASQTPRKKSALKFFRKKT